MLTYWLVKNRPSLESISLTICCHVLTQTQIGCLPGAYMPCDGRLFQPTDMHSLHLILDIDKSYT